MNLGFVIVLVTKVAVIWTSFSADDDVIVTFFRVLRSFLRCAFCSFPKSKSRVQK